MADKIFPKRLINTEEAAAYLNLKKQTLYNWRHIRKGPDYVMIGGSPKYEIDVLEKFIAANRIRLSE